MYFINNYCISKLCICLIIIFRYLNNLHDIYSISLVSKKYFSIFLGNPNLFNLLLNKYGGVYTKINPDLSNNLYNRIQIPKLFLEKRIIVNWNKKTFDNYGTYYFWM